MSIQKLVQARITELRSEPAKLDALRQDLEKDRRAADTHSVRDNIKAVAVPPAEYNQLNERRVAERREKEVCYVRDGTLGEDGTRDGV